MTTGSFAADAIRQHAASLAEHARTDDPEHVHQTRVATRRLRAALRVFKEALPPEVLELRPELKWLASQAGPVRDLDVQLERLHAHDTELAVEPYATWLTDQREHALNGLESALQSERFKLLSQRLASAEAADFPEPLAQQRLEKAARALHKRARNLRARSPAEAFHPARIRAKRLRYTAEFLEPLFGKPVRRLIARTTDLQDLLGNLQDAVVSTRRIREAVESGGSSWPADAHLALGRLIQLEFDASRRLRKDFKPTYREVRAAWSRLQDAL